MSTVSLFRLCCVGAVCAALLTPAAARAQDEEESSPSIDLGSSRIGGPGLTAREQRRVESWDEEEEYLTEENIPKPGDKKRLPALHTLASRYVTSKQWQEACTKYDAIESEFGAEGVASMPDGKTLAARAYFYCARAAANGNEADKAEALLQKSEKYGPTSAKHEMIREKLLREEYRKKLSNGDVDGAITLYKKAQAMREVEDERIWLGEELSKRAWEAHDTGDKVAMEGLMRRLEEIAPMNTDYRRLKDKLDAQDNFLKNAITYSGAVVLLLVVGTLLSRWRAKRRVLKAEGNPFDDL
jgi:hypothetical protein